MPSGAGTSVHHDEAAEVHPITADNDAPPLRKGHLVPVPHRRTHLEARRSIWQAHRYRHMV